LIKRYCDKMIKRFFHPIFFPVCVENIFLGTILNVLKCHYNILKKKIYFYQNVFLSFNQNLCAKMSCVYRALGPRHTRHFGTQYCDKKILQHKDIFGAWMSIGQGKLLSKHNARYIRFFMSLPWLDNRNLLLKIVKCRT